MEIAKIYVNGTMAAVSGLKKIPKGIAGATITVTFGKGWAGLTKTAVFQGAVTKDVLDIENVITIPAECVEQSGHRLKVGFYGVAGETLVIPTLWADLGTIQDATDPSGDTSTDPSLPIWAQLQAQIDHIELIPGPQGPQGPQGIQGIRGEKGETGDAGKDGQDYVLTDADKAEIAEQTAPLVEIPDSGQNGNGLSTTAANLLIEILRNGVYSADQSANITALAEALATTEPDEPDTPVEPDEPDVPEATLTGISATYSGGDVAVGTAVNDLTGIVVTAIYSDGTSKTVTDYTLSGTIAEGSNTITVSYGGKTATFAVTGVAESSGDIEETKTLTMTLHNGSGESTSTSLFYTGDADSEQLTAWNGWWYKSDAVADRDSVVNIAFTAGTVNTGLIYYAAQIKREDFKKFYYVEQLGTATTAETVKSYTVRAGYELVFLVGSSSEVAKLNVTYTDGDFTAPSELYTNLVDGFTLDAYLKSSDGSVTANWSHQNTSDMIDVSGIPSVYIWHIDQGNVLEQSALTCCFYDTAEKYISGGDSPANTDAIAPVAVPENAKYMRVGGSRNNTAGGVYVGVNPAPYRYELFAFK